VKRVLIDVRLTDIALQQLRAAPGLTVDVLPPPKAFRPLPAAQLRDVHVLLTKLPPQNFDDLRSLELLQLCTVGYDHLRDMKLATRRYATCNARGVFDTAIAEWNLAMMINLARDLPTMVHNQDASRWHRTERLTGELRGATVGLWGYGGIGRETARLARAFGMTVHVLTRGPVGPRGDNYAVAGTGDPDGSLPDRCYRTGSESEFLGGLDFLVLAIPHTRATNGLVGERELQSMRRSAFLLNPSRGAIVQEAALIQALEAGWIAGAALDAHRIEPLPAESRLWQLPNVILTPHISGSDRAALFPARMAELFLQNLGRLSLGQPLLNRLTPSELAEG
jgi:phosphoglycerate dehydrogenase-like enzyme